MIHILAADICILILTFASVAASGKAFGMLFAGGLLLIFVTLSHMSEGNKKEHRILQVCASLFFGFLSGEWFAFLPLCLLPKQSFRNKLLFANGAFLLRSLAAAILQKHFESRQLAVYLAEALLLSAASGLIFLLQYLVRKEETRRRTDEERLRRASLGEMYEMQRSSEMLRESYYENKNARLIERENISRNIHNSVGHSITAAIMTLDAADMLFEKKPEEAHRRMNDAAGRIRGSLEAIRSAVRALDAGDEDVSIKDLLCYTDNIIDEFMMDTDRSCDRVNDIYSENLMLPKEYAEFLSGALSELLTNGVKHGKATHFVVRIAADSAHVRLEVSDNGNGSFSEENAEERIRNGFGLKKISSYAQRCGGSTEYKNREGFHASIELPVRAEKEEA
ncbi:MAG: hypothetical protein K6E50_14605 [Lachnospiraceae bacterium]|nr:hypothetical protein [Lachnospiraceae bacterium]